MNSQPLGAEEFERLGLYDPAAPNAADRLATLEYLLTLGATEDELVGAVGNQGLPGLASDLAFRPGQERLTFADLMERTGLSPDEIRRVNLAAGLPVDEGAVFTEADVVTLSLFHVGAELFGEDAVLQMTRVMASSLTRIADAAVATFRTNVEAPIQEAAAGELSLAQANANATAALLAIPQALESMFRMHAQLAIRRSRATGDNSGAYQTARVTVGFIDVVGSTALSEQLGPAELGAAMSAFEARAWDDVTAYNARVVKQIGDEVMFVAVNAADACAIALSLVGWASTHPVLRAARGGLADGHVLTQGGDFYGPVVNLASRAAKVAEPGTVLVTGAVRDAVGDDAAVALASAGSYDLRGFADPVELFSVSRH